MRLRREFSLEDARPTHGICPSRVFGVLVILRVADSEMHRKYENRYKDEGKGAQKYGRSEALTAGFHTELP